jgi:hypothetical protein
MMLARREGTARRAAPDGAAPTPPDDALEAVWRTAQERRVSTLLAAFARQGGCLPADQFCSRLRGHWGQPLSRVARWIARRDVVSVTWRAQFLIPLFQFERPSLDLVPAARDAIRALRPVHDDWELAEWFVRPHDLLAGRSPAARLACDPCAVLEAACRDRFVNRWQMPPCIEETFP